MALALLAGPPLPRVPHARRAAALRGADRHRRVVGLRRRGRRRPARRAAARGRAGAARRGRPTRTCGSAARRSSPRSGARRETDFALLTDCIEPNRGDREFFIRKAIGWALRAYAWVEPEAVIAYCDTHELSPAEPAGGAQERDNLGRMADYTKLNLREVEDAARKFGMPDGPRVALRPRGARARQPGHDAVHARARTSGSRSGTATRSRKRSTSIVKGSARSSSTTRSSSSPPGTRCGSRPGRAAGSRPGRTAPRCSPSARPTWASATPSSCRTSGPSEPPASRCGGWARTCAPTAPTTGRRTSRRSRRTARRRGRSRARRPSSGTRTRSGRAPSAGASCASSCRASRPTSARSRCSSRSKGLREGERDAAVASGLVEAAMERARRENRVMRGHVEIAARGFPFASRRTAGDCRSNFGPGLTRGSPRCRDAGCCSRRGGRRRGAFGCGDGAGRSAGDRRRGRRDAGGVRLRRRDPRPRVGRHRLRLRRRRRRRQGRGRHHPAGGHRDRASRRR